MRRLVLAGLILGISTVASVAQVVSYERWTIYEPIIKALPAGYHHFVPVAPQLQQRQFNADGVVLCREWANAISYGQRLKDGMSESLALADMAMARRGDVACGYRPGLIIRPISYAVRGDRLGRQVLLIEWVDARGTVYFTGIPR